MREIYWIGACIFLCLSCEKSTPPAPPAADPNYNFETCLANEKAQTLEVMTWNLEHFPLAGKQTVEILKEIITEQKPDIIACQEIRLPAEFRKLADALDGYLGIVLEDGDLNLGFLYKTSEIALAQDVRQIVSGDFYALPREPILGKFTHINGIETYLIDIHLKCCGGDDNYRRRLAASNFLKNYIDDSLANESVIVLGDYNDEIYGIPDSENPFINFINDSTNYRFADMSIAKGSNAHWSYPDWPSHIDHILITNELFDYPSTTTTVAYDHCYERYFSEVSDHRPVMIGFSK